jgi:hypothetical protein
VNSAKAVEQLSSQVQLYCVIVFRQSQRWECVWQSLLTVCLPFPSLSALSQRASITKKGYLKLAVTGDNRCNGFTTRPSAITVFTKNFIADSSKNHARTILPQPLARETAFVLCRQSPPLTFLIYSSRKTNLCDYQRATN